MQIVFVLEGRVEDWLAAGGRVAVPRPALCPSCVAGPLVFDGWYRRQTRRGPVDIRRLLCSDVSCGQRSHSLLPDVLVSRRVDLASVIGWALEAKTAGVGHRRIADGLGVPASTVRGWLRRAAQVGRQIAEVLWTVAAGIDPIVRGPPSGTPVAVLVTAATWAARSWTALAGQPVERWRFAVRHVGGRLLG
ncbi:MAG: hypothetical protein ACR2HR_16700 [Euzebya sp.]